MIESRAPPSITVVKTLASAMAMVSSLACGTPSQEVEPETSPTLPTCAERLSPLRDELVLAQSWRDASVRADVAVSPQTEPSVPPEHIVELIDDSLSLADEHIIDLYYDADPDWESERAQERDASIRWEEEIQGRKLTPAERRRTLRQIEQTQADPEWQRRWQRHADRYLERRVFEGLKRPLTGSKIEPVALAIEHDEPWAVALPTLRAFAEHQGRVRLIVGTELPSHWRSPFVDELASKMLAEQADAIARRATVVLAGCPKVFERLSESFVAVVDAFEACDCRMDLDAGRELVYAAIIPLVPFHGVVELDVLTEGDATPFEAEPSARW